MTKPTGPTCRTCGSSAAVHWLRRLTDAERATQQAIEQARRDQALLLADRQLPTSDFGPMPDYLDATTPVYGCVKHAVTLDQAALIHTADCTAPPCNCTPEPHPAPPPGPEPAPLPPGW